MTNEEKEAIRALVKRDLLARTRGEWCLCRHERSDHDDTTSWGEGDCLVEACDCMKFELTTHKDDRS